MEFHVVTDKQMPRIQAGRSMIALRYRRDLADVGSGVEEHKTDTGHVKVSSPELTALDLLRYAPAVDGLDHVATVLVDLASKLDAENLAALSGTVERSVVRRLGYLLESLGYADRVGLMRYRVG